MALSFLCLRRSHSVPSSLLRYFVSPLHSSWNSLFDPPPVSTTNPLPLVDGESNRNLNPQHGKSFFSVFKSFSPSSSRPFSARASFPEDEKIGPDTILFEGCDYNHWLITVDFPKDPKPIPEEMVETYVQYAAQVFGSVEEAKKRIYACSTTTYNGFQVECSEETSEKFRAIPGVVFILPDSYIDPVNKEYGGDKYINGTIIPRPPPVQYGRSSRYNDRNRNYDRPRNDMRREPIQQQGPGQFERRDPQPFEHQNTMQGGRHYYPPPSTNFPQGGGFQNPMQGVGQNHPPPQGNFGPSGYQQNAVQGGGQGYPSSPPPSPPPSQGSFAPGGYQQNTMQGAGQGFPPPPLPPRNFASGGFQQNPMQSGYGPPMGRDYPPPDNRGFPQREQRDPLPPFGMGGGNYGSRESRDFSQDERRDQPPPQQKDISGMDQKQFPNSGQANYGQGYPQTREGASGMGYGDAMPVEQRGSSGNSGHGQGWR